MTLRTFSFACTDVGRKRDNNQDRYRLALDLNLFLVADGMGGHAGGEVASRLAVDVIERSLRDDGGGDGSPPSVAHRLAAAVRTASREIYERRQTDVAIAEMGTTATGVLVRDQRAFLAHVGDSRCYLLRDNRIHQLSEDHSLVFQQVKAGLITEEEARRSPFKNIITRALGADRDVEVDVATVELRSGDALLLCSDGLSGLVSDDEINASVNESFLHRVPERLVDLANERGGPDNITVVLVYFLDEREIPSG